MPINRLVEDINKSYGGKKDVLKKASDLPPMRTLPFGVPALDLDLGGGAFWGRTIEFAGAKGTGKTSCGYALAGQAQNIGMPVYWFDLEKAFDSERARIFGANPDDIYVARGGLTAEIVFAMLRDTIRGVQEKEDSRALFVVDSIASMVKEGLVEETANKVYGGSANIINQSIAVWNMLLGDNQILLLINQLRDKLGGMGEPDMMPGGRAQEFYASAIVWTRAGETLKDGTDVTGQQMKWTIKKSRGSNPKEIGQIDYDYQKGFQAKDNLVAVALELEIIKRTGAWYILPDGEKVQGMKELVAKLSDYPEFLAGLQKQVYDKMPIPRWDGK